MEIFVTNLFDSKFRSVLYYPI